MKFNIAGSVSVELVEPPAPIVTLNYNEFTVTIRGNIMAYTLPNDHAVQVKISYVDSHGHPATIDGDVSWETSSETIAKVQVDGADSTLAMVVPGTDIGQVQITARADADLGEGTREVITTMDVEVVAGAAVSGTITPVGEPSPIEVEHRT